MTEFLLNFVSIITARSAWSRANIPLEIGDIPEEEAVKFLKESGTDQTTAEFVVKHLTGGRFALLKQFQIASKHTNPEGIIH